MTLREVAGKLCELCGEGRYEEAMESLYAPDAVQVEGMQCGEMPRETKGLPDLRKRAEAWDANTVVHSATVGKPMFYEPDRFACTMGMDCTMKEGPMPGRQLIEEICVYTVKNGKIVRAEFFY